MRLDVIFLYCKNQATKSANKKPGKPDISTKEDLIMENETDRIVMFMRELVNEHERRASTTKKATWGGEFDGYWGAARMAIDAYDKYARVWKSEQKRGVTVTMPAMPTRDMLQAVRTHQSTKIGDADEMHRRIGWLSSAWFVMVDAGAIMPDEKIKED